MKIVSVLNHKGGVGKTTFTGCVGQALALSGFRVLAIDNDSQHNLSTLLSTGVHTPNIRSVYRSRVSEAPTVFLQSIRRTEIRRLHIVTAQSGLVDGDVQTGTSLRACLGACNLSRFYDCVLIDNAPGMGRLQEASILASDEIFVPTELRQFAIDGITEMEALLNARYPGAAKITKIIPNFYRDTKRQNSFRMALVKMFGERVTETSIPADNVFDELVTEGKILFLHRLFSKGAAYYLKIVFELFGLDENTVWENMVEKRRERLSEDARRRFYERQERLEQAARPHRDSVEKVA